MRTMRVLYLAAITLVGVALVADGGIIWLLLPLLGWAVMEIAGVFRTPEPRGSDHRTSDEKPRWSSRVGERRLSIKITGDRNNGFRSGVKMGQAMHVRTDFMAPVAGLLMIIGLIAFCRGIPHGYTAKIATKFAECGDRPGLTIIHIRRNGQVSINGEVIRRDDLKLRLHKIFANRAERLAYLSADGNAEFALVGQAIDLAHDEVDYLALLTPAIETMSGCLGITMPPSFDFVRPPLPSHVKEVPGWRIWR
jgi:hypothetical protein